MANPPLMAIIPALTRNKPHGLVLQMDHVRNC